MCDDRHGPCWPGRRPIRYGVICGCLFHPVYLGQKSLAEPIPLQAVDHRRKTAWSRTCGLRYSWIMHPGQWFHRGNSCAHTRVPCQHPSLWFSPTDLQGSRRLWRAGLSSSRTEWEFCPLPQSYSPFKGSYQKLPAAESDRHVLVCWTSCSLFERNNTTTVAL